MYVCVCVCVCTCTMCACHILYTILGHVNTCIVLRGYKSDVTAFAHCVARYVVWS